MKAVLLLEEALEGSLRKGDLVQQTDELGSVTAEGHVAADSSGNLVDVPQRALNTSQYKCRADLEQADCCANHERIHV